jgi:predicted helicase
MASYAMAHLQLDLLLKETGFKPTKDQRTRVYLTNSLEEYHPDTGTLFANWLSSEANEANHIKRDTPVMCVIGNPPYAVSSTNKNPWIENLIADYKKNLKEKSYNSLSDDYVKFIRYGQHFVDKNGSGILAYISNNSFIDGLVFRQMRKNLLESFDKIYIVDLHGNAKKKELCPDGSVDQNVFDIMAGVSINIFIKTGKKNKKSLGDLFHYDLQGKRDLKYDFLKEQSIKDIYWKRLKCENPNYYFSYKDMSNIKQYETGFKIDNIFKLFASGMTTERDSLVVNFSITSIEKLIVDFESLEPEELRLKYDNKKDGRDWKYSFAKNDVIKNNGKVVYLNYRPFDKRYSYYTGKSKGIMAYPRNDVMQHLLKDNLGLISKRGFDEDNAAPAFITKNVFDRRGWSRPGMQGAENVFPLYVYPNNSEQETIEGTEKRRPNLNHEIVEEIAKKLDLTFTNEKGTAKSTLAPIDILDYIYAALHSLTYREKYKEFLKIDFPRVPYPTDQTIFWKLVKLGGEIRQIHLLESPKVEDYITTYPKGGDNTITTKVGKKDWELFDEEKQLGRIWINDEQYFDNIPLTAWEFYIGGYQPAQKWLKDRQERTLEFDDILHYQKIIVALSETDRLMKEIDKIEIE